MFDADRVTETHTARPDRLPEMLHDVRELVECESPSVDQAAIARSADLVARIGRERLGAEADRIAIEGCSHLRWRFGRRPARVVLLAHHDTVWPQGTLERIPFAIQSGVLRGPGCFDMKTGLVQAFHALAGLLADGESIDGTTLLVTGDEEIGSPTSRSLIEEEAAGCVAALVLEASGPGGALKVGRKGVSLYDVEVTGRAAHAGLEPEAGVNAAVEIAHQVHAVLALGDTDRGTTVTPTVLRAGTTTNTVPAHAALSVDARMWTDSEQQRVDRAMRGLTAQVPTAGIEVRGGPNRPPLQRDSSTRLARIAQDLAPTVGIDQLSTMSVGGASDGNFTAGIGVPTLDGLGAVGDGAHAEHEHVLVEHIVPRTELLAALIRRLLHGESREADVIQ